MMEETEYINILTQEVENSFDIMMSVLHNEIDELSFLIKEAKDVLFIKKYKERRIMIAKVILYFENRTKDK